MPGRPIEATKRGLALIAKGMSRAQAAAKVGVNVSTLTRARKAAGMAPGTPGRKPKTTAAKDKP